MNEETPDQEDVPIAAEDAVPRRALLSKTDQTCVATLATLALVAIGFNSFSLGGDHRALVDLRYPVLITRDQQAEIGFQLDVNSAEWPAWTLLPRVGETLARRIVDSRERHGSFKSLDDLRRVPGIGPKTLANIRRYLLPIETVGPP